jgi:HEAT repeat protein
MFWTWGLKSKLKSPDAAQRKAALELIVSKHAVLVWLPEIMRASTDADASVRGVATGTLVAATTSLEAARTLSVLRDAAKSATPEVSSAATAILNAAAERALKTVREAAEWPQRAEMQLAAFGVSPGKCMELLAELGDERAIPALIKIVQADRASMSLDAAGALGQFRSKAKEAVPALTQALVSDVPLLYQAAMVAIADIAGKDEAALRLVAASALRKAAGKRELF